MHRLIRTLAVVFCSTVAFAAQAPAPPAPAAAPTALWSLTGHFASPESAFYDAATQSIFVSSINGAMTAKDGNGYISRISADGKTVNAMWATGLHGPKGIRGAGGTLWVSDIDEVVAIDIASGRVTSRVPIPGAQFLNDLATAPDGTVYVVDSLGSRIHVVRDGKPAVFVEGAEVVEQGNGLLVDGGRLILGTIGPAGRGGGGGRGRGGAGASGGLYAFDLQTRSRTRLTSEPVGGIDGVEPDGKRGVIVTDVFGRRIVQVTASGETRVLAQLAGGGADFGYDVARGVAIVPYLNEHKVEAYDLRGALK